MTIKNTDLLSRAHAALVEDDPYSKCRLVDHLQANWLQGKVLLDANKQIPPVTHPGRPLRPKLVNPRELPRRGLGTEAGRAALIHAIAHIEFNAINLALDAICRYRQLPADYYADWLKVAQEESKHFNLLQNRLQELGYCYGDLVAHNGLWEVAMRTAHDPIHRMAMVPRMMEARGLDITPDMIKRFRKLGDDKTTAILEVILREEIGHVETGSRWFRYLCEKRGIDAEQNWIELIQVYLGDDIRCPLHWETRRQAGFTDNELEQLQQLCSKN